MIPIEMRDFINVMSLVIFGGILLTAVFTLFAYLFAIDRRKAAKKLFTEEESAPPVAGSSINTPAPAESTTPPGRLNRW